MFSAAKIKMKRTASLPKNWVGWALEFPFSRKLAVFLRTTNILTDQQLSELPQLQRKHGDNRGNELFLQAPRRSYSVKKNIMQIYQRETVSVFCLQHDKGPS